MKKRVLSILLVALMVMGLCTVAFAADPAVKVTFTNTNEDVDSPAETFTFSEFTEVSIKNGGTNAAFPATKPTIASAAFTEGAATSSVSATITLPEFPDIGIYTYSFTQVDNKTAGVTYDNKTYYLVVTVQIPAEGGEPVVTAVHCEGATPVDGVVPPNGEDKTGEITNKYESGTLAVTKEVKGNMGDKSKYFDVTVTFTPASGETINSTITYTGGQYAQAVTVANNTAKIQVKNGDTVTFTNVPEGVTWKVEEADYTSDGYDAAEYSTQTAAMTAGGEATCTITNNKDTTVDTGINMDTIPYIMIALFVCLAAAVVVIRKRRIAE